MTWVKSIVKNKVIIYLVTRYLTYAIQFITSLIIAEKLGPFYMGIWGFVLLVLNYLGQFHFGIANSLNVLLVQHKENQQKYNGYITNSLSLMIFLSLLIGFVYLYYVLFGVPIVEEYQAGKYIGTVCLIAILQYFNGIFVNIFRVKNMLNSISITQTLVVILPFLVVFFYKDSQLVDALVASYFMSNLICAVYAIFMGIVPRPVRSDLSISTQKEILVKGIFLFINSTCFAFIVISIRSVVSSNYSVEDFGLFTFAYTLGNAIMMLMDAFAFIALPKVISLFNSESDDIVKVKVKSVHDIYMTASYLVTYIFLPLMPLLSYIMPQYHRSIVAFNLIVLSLALNTTNYPYSSLLIARNKEKTAALIAFVALLINIIIALILVKGLHVNFNNVAIATLFANLFICAASYFACAKELKDIVSFREFFPIRLLIPYCIAVFISVLGYSSFLWLPIIVFIILNIPLLKTLLGIIVHLIKDASIINI